jgi:hypothetical protein
VSETQKGISNNTEPSEGEAGTGTMSECDVFSINREPFCSTMFMLRVRYATLNTCPQLNLIKTDDWF